MNRKYKQKGPKLPETPSKFLIAIGGLIGFGVTFGVSFFTGGDQIRALVLGATACLIGAFVMKILARYIEKNLDQILNEKAEAIRARREAELAEEYEIPPTFQDEEPKVPTAGELES